MNDKPILLLTRPRAQSEGFADQCRAAGFAGEIVVAPVLEIVGRPLMAPPAPGTTLIFTSANGVLHATAQADLAGFAAMAVGDKTARAAQAAGLACVSAGGDVYALLALLAGQADTGPVLHLRGAHSTGDLVARLRTAGRRADEAVVYDQTPHPLSAAARRCLRGKAPVIVPLFSPRSARILADALAPVTAPLWPIAISTAAAAAWTGGGAMQVVAHPDAAQMLDAVLVRGGNLNNGSALVAREPNS